MLRALWVLLLLFTVSIAAAQDDASQTPVEFTDHPAQVVYGIPRLNVRRTPAIEADNYVGILQSGQQVQVLAREGEWRQVRREDGLFGWSHSDYLIDLPPRQLEETRRFTYLTTDSTYMSTDAVLHYIGAHSYIYLAEEEVGAETVIDPYWLQRLGQEFDERVYPETAAFWETKILPNHEGDERIVILLSNGRGGYYVRSEMPGELNASIRQIGYIETPVRSGLNSLYSFTLMLETLSHNLQYLFQFQVDRGYEDGWVIEGLASFAYSLLGFEDMTHTLAEEFLTRPETQLTALSRSGDFYGGSMLFMSYISEQFSLDVLRDFAHHPARGLTALDAALNAIGSDQDADAFFADWVLANYLQDQQLKNGRFGYQMLDGEQLSQPPVIDSITELPWQIQETVPQYATHYYEIALPADDPIPSLEMQLSFPSSAQDGWLQLVQVIDDAVSVQRFRASEHRGDVMQATLLPDASQAFLAVSPFSSGRRRSSTQPARYTLKLNLEGG